MTRCLVLFCLIGVLTGCATTQAAQVKVAGDAVLALTKLKQAPVLQIAPKDAAATKVWVANQGFDPMTLARANACPDAVLLASQDFGVKIDSLITGLQGMQTPQDPALADGRLILLLTQAKYGKGGPNPQAQLTQLKQDVAGRVDFVVTSCLPLIPYKQMKEILQLASEAGLTAYMPALAPLAGPLTGAIFALTP